MGGLVPFSEFATTSCPACGGLPVAKQPGLPDRTINGRQALQLMHPSLETSRLLLRPFVDSDLDAYARICADPEVMRYLGPGKPISRSQAWRSMAYFRGHW